MTITQLGYIEQAVENTTATATTITAPASVAITAGGSDASIASGAGFGSTTVAGSDSGQVNLASGVGGIGTTGGRSGDVVIGTGTGVTTNGASGNIVLVSGAGSTTGVSGCIFKRAPSVVETVATVNTMTVKNTLGGYITISGGVGAVTTPTGTDISTGIGSNVAVGDSFELFVDCDQLTTTGIATITAGAGVTVIGAGTVPQEVGALLKFVCTAANTWVVLVLQGL